MTCIQRLYCFIFNATRQKHNQSMLHCLLVIQSGNQTQQNNSSQSINIITGHIQIEMKRRTKEEETGEGKGDDLCLIKQVPSQTMFKWRRREGRRKMWWSVPHQTSPIPAKWRWREEDKEEEKGVSHQTSPIPAHVQMERKRRKNKKKRRKVMTCASLIKQELGWRSQLSQHPLWWSRNNTSHTHSVFISDVLILLCSIKLAVFTFWILHCKFSLFHNYIMVHSILLCAYIYMQNWPLVSTLFWLNSIYLRLWCQNYAL